MSRPPCCRRVRGTPAALAFGPEGPRLPVKEGITLRLDEFEALRLADLEGLYHETAARRMGVSRPTFGRIVASARRKVAEFLVLGKALRIEGVPGPAVQARETTCSHCHLRRPGGGAPRAGCPRCGRHASTKLAPPEDTP